MWLSELELEVGDLDLKFVFTCETGRWMPSFSTFMNFFCWAVCSYKVSGCFIALCLFDATDWVSSNLTTVSYLFEGAPYVSETEGAP